MRRILRSRSWSDEVDRIDFNAVGKTTDPRFVGQEHGIDERFRRLSTSAKFASMLPLRSKEQHRGDRLRVVRKDRERLRLPLSRMVKRCAADREQPAVDVRHGCIDGNRPARHATWAPHRRRRWPDECDAYSAYTRAKRPALIRPALSTGSRRSASGDPRKMVCRCRLLEPNARDGRASNPWEAEALLELSILPCRPDGQPHPF